MSIEAMKQALQALDWRFSNADAAIEALRQAIEQAEKQEPEKEKESTSLNVDPRLLLGRNINCTKNIENRLCDLERRMAKIETHPAPPRKEWVGLTDEEINAIGYKYGAGGLDLMDELSAMLKERNT